MLPHYVWNAPEPQGAAPDPLDCRPRKYINAAIPPNVSCAQWAFADAEEKEVRAGGGTAAYIPAEGGGTGRLVLWPATYMQIFQWANARARCWRIEYP